MTHTAEVAVAAAHFIKGINYWPARKAMYWWKDFDLQEAEQDFRKMHNYHLDVVRIFLLWEDFQPQARQISLPRLDHLKRLADLSNHLGMQLMPTFFCGHMSGVNWFPEWALTAHLTKQRFPVFANGHLRQAAIRNFYVDEAMLEAQLLQVRKISRSLAGHPAIYAYDLGNESSNCVIPPDRSQARLWLQTLSAEIRRADPAALITLGLHAEDLEENRHLWPQDAALFCDFLCMHGYPFYLAWVADPFDQDLVPFLGLITRWLGKKDVLFQEFGAPTQNPAANQTSVPPSSCQLWTETRLAGYYHQTLPVLQQAGFLGAMAWCFTDYQASLWHKPPLQANLHERYFGLFRADGQAKPAACVWRDYTVGSCLTDLQPGRQADWLPELEPDRFYDHPQENLVDLFRDYKIYLERK